MNPFGLSSKLTISRILHAGYIFKCNQTQIAFDPIFENPFSRNCYAFPNVEFDLSQIEKLHLDAVFISHYHDDHCSLESLNHLQRETPIYAYCIHEELFEMLREMGFKNVTPLRIDKAVQVGSIEVTPRRALDEDVDSLFQIKAAGLNILNVVDSWIDEDTLKVLAQESPWDMILWPFQTMREIEVIAPSPAANTPVEIPKEWLKQLQILNPKYIVPSSCQFIQESWSWYNHALFPITYKFFQEEIAKILPLTQVVRLNPSVSIDLDKNSLAFTSPLAWIKTVGDQNVDYNFQPELTPPPTHEIAQRFLALSAEQTQRVFKYCEKDLLEKYNSLPPNEEVYFQTPKLWQLSLFDHNGKGFHFYYSVEARNLKRLDQMNPSPDWSTEVAIARLYGALAHGESLTSMYMRINAPPFEDIVDDPLVASLFNGEFGSYQKAQLLRLQR